MPYPFAARSLNYEESLIGGESLAPWEGFECEKAVKARCKKAKKPKRG